MEKESFEERRPMRYQIPDDKKKSGGWGGVDGWVEYIWQVR